MGRGGAGNHIPQEELLKQAEDIEAQNKADKRLSTANQLAQEELVSPTPGEYKHMGRGGAGNWFQPSELNQNGTTATPEEDEDATEVPAAEKPSVRQWSGRGGAGNFAGNHQQLTNPNADELKKAEEIELQERLEEVRRSVDVALPKPPSAHLSGGYRSS